MPIPHLPRRFLNVNSSVLTGFTLVELMISVVIGALLIGGVATALIAHIRSTLNLEFSQQIQNDLSRLTFFLETEVREGSAISTTATTPVANCGAASGTTSLFTIIVPQLNAQGFSLPTSTIDYYASGTGNTASLVRCGPPINNNGTLNFAGTSTATTISTNTTLTVTSSNSTSVTYSLTLRDPGGSRSVTRTGITNRVEATLIN